MNNEPVAWTTKFPKTVQDFSFYQTQIYTEPLYAHPVNPYQSITDTKIEPTVVSYTHPVKEEHFEDEPKAEELP